VQLKKVKGLFDLSTKSFDKARISKRDPGFYILEKVLTIYVYLYSAFFLFLKNSVNS